MKKLLTRFAISAFGLCGTLTIGTALSTACPAAAKGKIIPHEQWWHSIRYSPDGAKVALITPPPPWFMKHNDPKGKAYKGQLSARKKLVILNAKDFSLITKIDFIEHPTWSPNSKYVCTNDYSTKNRSQAQSLALGVYHASNGAKLLSINDAPLGTYAWSPDSQRLFVTHRESLSILDIEKKRETLLPFKANENYFQLPQWSPDGKSIAASLRINVDGEQKEAIRIWDAKSEEVKAEINLKDGIRMLAWTPNGKLLIYSEPLAITVLDADSKKVITTIETKETKAVRFGWSHDKTKFSYRDGGVFHILDAATMKETARIVGPTVKYLNTGGYINIDWSADDDFILISAQNTAAICDAKSGKYIGYKTWPDAIIHTISPDQKLLIIQSVNSQTEIEPIALPPALGMSPFKDGKTGSPTWD